MKSRKIKIALIVWIAVMISLIVSIEVRATEYSEEELLERVVEAEAGNQDLHGKRLVASVILNRVDNEKFPNGIRDVLTAPHQFTTVSNGSINRVTISDETRIAVALEMTERTDEEILYFNNGPVSGKYAYTYKAHQFGK